jgi:hypothetical protein
MLKDCRTFQRMRGIFGAAQHNATRQGFTGAPGTIALDAPPPPPALPHNPVLAIHGPPAGNANQGDAYISSRGAVNMIQMGRPSNQDKKIDHSTSQYGDSVTSAYTRIPRLVSPIQRVWQGGSPIQSPLTGAFPLGCRRKNRWL